MGLKFSGTNYEDQNGIEKYIKDGTIIMSSELRAPLLLWMKNTVRNL